MSLLGPIWARSQSVYLRPLAHLVHFGTSVPTVVLTCSRDDDAARQPIDALRRGGWRGGIEVVRPWDELPDVECCGLLLAGGLDVEPRRWDPGDGSAFAHETDPERDAIELALVGQAWAKRLPILGLCRGSQVLAVARGGLLLSDIATATGGDSTAHLHGTAQDQDVRHRVTVHPRSRLARILGATDVAVNSRHHQAVRDPGDGLMAVAHDHDTTLPDGSPHPSPNRSLVEAIEAVDPARWVIGVQWHPENLVRRIDAAGVAAFRLFSHFVRAARRTAMHPPIESPIERTLEVEATTPIASRTRAPAYAAG